MLKKSDFTSDRNFAEALVRWHENYVGTSSSARHSTGDSPKSIARRMIASEGLRRTPNEKT
jgi:hypothetical protein